MRSPATRLPSAANAPRSPPDYKLPEDEQEADKVLAGAADLAYTMTYEVLPKITLGDFKTMKVERPVVEVADADVDAQLSQLADSARAPSRPRRAPAETGDRLTISYVGKIDGEPFEGGSDDNASVTIGDGRFIPGLRRAARRAFGR